MTDPETLAVYAASAQKYSDDFGKPDSDFHDPDLDAFSAVLSPGAKVLDWGCGPGHWSSHLARRGFAVTATDASPEMVAVAEKDFGIAAEVATFEDLTAEAAYDGVWANFSLLHAPKADFPGHIARARRALVPGGWLHIGMKLGSGEKRDSLGRFYAYFEEDELCDLLNAAGFTVTRTRQGEGKGLAGDVEPFVIILAHA